MEMSGQLHTPAALPQEWVGPRAGVDTAVARRKPPSPAGNETPDVQPLT